MKHIKYFSTLLFLFIFSCYSIDINAVDQKINDIIDNKDNIIEIQNIGIKNIEDKQIEILNSLSKEEKNEYKEKVLKNIDRKYLENSISNFFDELKIQAKPEEDSNNSEQKIAFSFDSNEKIKLREIEKGFFFLKEDINLKDIFKTKYKKIFTKELNEQAFYNLFEEYKKSVYIKYSYFILAS